MRPAEPRVKDRTSDPAKEPDRGEPLPHFRREPGDPVLPDGQIGVRIATPGAVGGEPETALWRLDGFFRVPRAAAGPEPAGPEAVLRRIVLAVTVGSSHDVQARHVFQDELLFPEDVYDAGDVIEGVFHVDLLRTFDFIAAADTYFICASIGPYISEIIRREALLPWLAPPLETMAQVEPLEPEEEALPDEPEEEDDGSWEVDDPF